MLNDKIKKKLPKLILLTFKAHKASLETKITIYKNKLK